MVSREIVADFSFLSDAGSSFAMEDTFTNRLRLRHRGEPGTLAEVIMYQVIMDILEVMG